MATIFDILKRITLTKDKWEDIPIEEQEVFNKYMVNRFISMNEDYVEVVNTIQRNSWQMPTKNLYEIYRDILPKRQVFLKYIKAPKNKTHKPELIEAVQNVYEISKKEAAEYLDLMSKQEIKELLEEQGIL